MLRTINGRERCSVLRRPLLALLPADARLYPEIHGVVGDDLDRLGGLELLAVVRRQVVDLWKKGLVTLCLCAETLKERLLVLARLGLQGCPRLTNC